MPFLAVATWARHAGHAFGVEEWKMWCIRFACSWIRHNPPGCPTISALLPPELQGQGQEENFLLPTYRVLEEHTSSVSRKYPLDTICHYLLTS